MAGPTIPVLGIFPSVQSIGAQLLAVAVVALGYFTMNRSQRKALQAERQSATSG